MAWTNFDSLGTSHKQLREKLWTVSARPLDTKPDVSEINSLRYERNQLRKQRSQPTVGQLQSGHSSVDSTVALRQEEKRQNRQGFQSRIVLPNGEDSRRVSPYLQMNQMTHLSISERLRLFSRNHKCPHARAWNDYQISGRLLTPKCDHQYERILGISTEMCPVCRVFMHVVDRFCGCPACACSKCKATYYHIPRMQHFELTGWCFGKSAESIDTHHGAMLPMILALQADTKRPLLRGDSLDWTELNRARKLMSPESDIKDHWLRYQISNYSSFSSTSRSLFYSSLKQQAGFSYSQIVKPQMIEFMDSSFSFVRPFLDAVMKAAGFLKDRIASFAESVLVKSILSSFPLLQDAFEFCSAFFNAFIHVFVSFTPFDFITIAAILRYSSSNIPLVAFFLPKVLDALPVLIPGSSLSAVQTLKEIFSSRDFKNLTASFSKPHLSSEGKVSFGPLNVPKFETEVRPQSFESFLSFFSGLATCPFGKGLMNSILSFCKNVLPLLSCLNQSVRLTSVIWTWLKRSLTGFVDRTEIWMGEELRDPDSPICKLSNAAISVHQAHLTSDAAGVPNLQTAARTHLLAATAYLKEHSRYDRYSIQYLRDIENLITRPAPPGVREYEPFCLKLVGAPGVGKSTSYRTLIAPIFGAESHAEIDKLTYARNAKDDFWDGCIGADGNCRPIVVFDDFGQDRATESDYLELIALVSTQPFMPPLSSLTGASAKGQTYSPKVVVCLSNINMEQPTTLQDSGAIHRRFHVTLEVRRSPDGPMFNLRKHELGQDLPYVRDINTALMTIEEAQEFIYHTYASFVRSRQLGVEKFHARMKTNLPALINTKSGKYEFIPTSQSTSEEIKNRNNYELNMARRDATYYSAGLTASKNELADFSNSTPQMFEEIRNMGAQVFFDRENRFFTTAMWTATLIAKVSFFKDVYEGKEWSQWKTVKSYAKSMILPASVALLWAGTTYYRSFAQEQSLTSKDRTGLVKRTPITVTHQSQDAQPQSRDIILSTEAALQRNLVVISIQCGLIDREVHGIFVRGTIALFPEHIFIDPRSDTAAYFPDGTSIKLSFPYQDEPVWFEFNNSRIHPLSYDDSDTCDAVLYEFEPKISARKDIVSKFWNGEYRLLQCPGSYLDYASSSFVWHACHLDGMERVRYKVGAKSFSHVTAMSDHPGRNGACGNPVLNAAARDSQPIIGVHIAWSDAMQRSCVLLITRHMLERALPFSSSFVSPPDLDSPITSSEVVPNFGYQLVHGHVESVGTMNRAVYSPNKTTLRPSQLYDKVVPHTKEPSVISQSDPRLNSDKPLWYDGIHKLSHPTVLFDTAAVEQVKSDMIEYYKGLTMTSPRRPLTLDEALNGSPLFPHINSLDMGTSPGLPFTHLNISKDQLFDIRNERRYPTALFMEYYVADWELVQQRQSPLWLCSASLKDELRPLSKIYDKTKTRLFSVCNLVEVIMEKQLYGPFMELLMQNQHIVPYAGGVDRLGGSWHNMISQLTRMSPLGFCGDYGSYDGKLPAQLMEAAMDIMFSILDNPPEEWKIAHDVLKYAACNPIYALQGTIFQKLGSVASGKWLTQLLDTIANEILFRLAWNELSPPVYANRIYFEQSVAQKIMGDDNQNHVTPRALDWFNGTTYSAWCAKYGLEYTSADKNGEAKAVEPFEDMSFLKNKTGYFKHMYCPLMELDSALETLNWIRKSTDHTPDQLTEINANCVLRSIFFYGPEYYNSIRSRILELKPQYRLLPYGYLHRTFLSYGCFPGATPGVPSLYELQGALLSKDDKEFIEHETIAILNMTSHTVHPQMSESDATISYTGISHCKVCQRTFTSSNRMLDHLMATHSVKVDETLPATDVISTASVFQLRSFYEDGKEILTHGPAAKPKTVFGRRMHTEMTKQEVSAVYSRLNEMIHAVKTGTFENVLKWASKFESNVQHDTLVELRDNPAWIGLYSPEEIELFFGELGSDLTSLHNDYYRKTTFLQYQLAQRGSVRFPGLDVKPQMLEPANQSTPAAPEVAPVVTTTDLSIPLADPSDESTVQENKMGFILSDKGNRERKPILIPGKGRHSNLRAELSLNDVEWTLQAMLSKWTNVAVIPWSLTDAPETILQQFVLPTDVLTNHNVAAPFTLFHNFRCQSLHFKLILTGSKFHQGRLMVTGLPTMGASLLFDRTLKQEIQIGGVQLDPATGGDIEYSFMFRHIKGFLDLVANDSLGVLRFRVLSQLKAAAGASNSVSVRLLFRMEGAEFKVPRASSTSFTRTRQLLSGYKAPSATFSSLSLGSGISVIPQMKASSGGSAQITINDVVSEGAFIAPVRAKTGDPEVPHFGEQYNTLRDLGKRYRRFRKYKTTLGAGNTVNYVIRAFDVVGHFWQMPLFALYRGGLNFKFVHRAQVATSNVVDTLCDCTVFLDDSGIDSGAYTEFDFRNAFMNDPPVVRCPAGQSAEFTIPWLNHCGTVFNPFLFDEVSHSHQDYFDARNIVIRIENEANSNSTTSWLEVWVALADEFTAGVFMGAPIVRAFQTTVDNWTPTPIVPTLAPVKEGIEVKPQMLSRIGSTLDQIIERVNPVEMIVDGILGSLDKPQIPAPPQVMKIRQIDYLNAAKGPGYMDNMTLDPANQVLSDAAHYGCPQDEFRLTMLQERKSFFRSFNWKTTDDVGTILFSHFLGPMCEGQEDLATNTGELSLLSFVSKEFAFWRGGITLLFDVVCSAFHEGKLDITYHPNRLVTPPDYEASVSQYTTSVTVRNTENAFAVTFPYLGETPWKRVWNGVTVHENDFETPGHKCVDYFLGAFSVRVANILHVPNNVANNVDVNIYIIAADDYQVNGVTLRNKSLYSIGQFTGPYPF